MSDIKQTTKSPIDLEASPEVGRLIRDATLQYLNPRQKPEFISEIEAFYEWSVSKGVDIEDEHGQTDSTASNNVRRITRILPTIWDAHDGYTLQISPELCDWYVEQLKDDKLTKQNGDLYADSTKRKHVCALLAFTRFRWDQRSGTVWEPERMFGSASRSSPIADPITLDERSKVREASLEYKTFKQYSNCSPEERDRIKRYIAQRLEKPKDEVTKSDWRQENRCWKVPALIMLGLDIGPRPMEVKRAKTGWLKLSSKTIEIPSEDAVKNDATWENPMTITRENREDARYRNSPREMATTAICLESRSLNQFLPSLNGALWSGSPANNGVQTKVCRPSRSDRTVRGKSTTGTRMWIQTKVRGPRPISDTIGRVPSSTVAPVSRLPANRPRVMQPTTGRFDS